MPELPEVEVTRRSFADRIAGGHVVDVHLGKALRWPLGCTPTQLVGAQVIGVTRRGKYLLCHLVVSPGMASDYPPADGGPLLLLHLGMSGSLQFGHDLPPPGQHDHFSLRTTEGELRLNDPRRFGAVVYAPSQNAPVVTKLLGALGVEPLSDQFDPHIFAVAMRRRRSPVKQVLLSGTVVVGVGNIYASEVLHLAGIRPSAPAHRIGVQRLYRLHEAIRHVLAIAVERGGSTLRNFSNADGHAGHFQDDAWVYGREGLLCKGCTTPIRRMVQGGRSTFYCPQCQRG